MAMPDLNSAIEHYNEIPIQCIENANSILDIGSSNGVMAKLSNHSYIFDKVNAKENYLGIDIQKFPFTHYLIKQVNLLDFESEKKYDLVLALHVIEHFDIQKWEMIFDKLYNWVAKNGYLVINVPFKQKEVPYNNKPKYMRHRVFQIKSKTLEQFLSGGHYWYSDKINFFKTSLFKTKNEFFLYALFRLIYRVLTFHPYSIFKRQIYPQRLIGVWQKND